MSRTSPRHVIRTGDVASSALLAMDVMGGLEAACDENLHDLVGAAVDALRTCIAVHAGDRILEHVARPAMQLNAGVHHAALSLCHPILRHRRGCGVELARKVALDTMVYEDPRDRCLGLAFGQSKLRVLKVDD